MSVAARRLSAMTDHHDQLVTCPLPAAGESAGAANEAIRELVRRHGDRPWGAAERAELQRLYGIWLAAVRSGIETAA